MRKITTSQAPAAIGPYSQAVAAGGFLFVSGQVPLDPATGELLEGPFELQVRAVLNSLRAILEAGGSSLGQVVKVEIFLLDLADFAEVNRIYATYFTSPVQPARATVQVAALPRNARIEIACTALCGP